MKRDTGGTVAANQAVHTALVQSGEYNKSPHFRAENIAKVRRTLEALCARLPQSDLRSLLDIGCGTGFMIDIADDLFEAIHGVDVTPAMLADVTPRAHIKLHLALAEHLPFADASFDMVSAYSFMDHLDDYVPVLQEARRVLKPGGIFYADLNPNRHFSDNLAALEQMPGELMPEVVAREVQGMLHNGEYYEQNFGIDAQTLEAAEPLKSRGGGFDADEVTDAARTMGFQDAQYHYDWYLGQAVMLHQHEAGQAEVVEGYLRMGLPATRMLFKYVRFVLTR